jgi:hypothetical protein
LHLHSIAKELLSLHVFFQLFFFVFPVLFARAFAPLLILEDVLLLCQEWLEVGSCHIGFDTHLDLLELGFRLFIAKGVFDAVVVLHLGIVVIEVVEHFAADVLVFLVLVVLRQLVLFHLPAQRVSLLVLTLNKVILVLLDAHLREDVVSEVFFDPSEVNVLRVSEPNVVALVL